VVSVLRNEITASATCHQKKISFSAGQTTFGSLLPGIVGILDAANINKVLRQKEKVLLTGENMAAGQGKVLRRAVRHDAEEGT